RDQHLRRLAAFVLEGVWRADRHVGEHSRYRHDSLAVDRERDLAFEDVESFLLPAVDVQRRTAALRHDRFPQGVFAVRVLARRQKAIDVTDDCYRSDFCRTSQRWFPRHPILPSQTFNIAASDRASVSRWSSEQQLRIGFILRGFKLPK